MTVVEAILNFGSVLSSGVGTLINRITTIGSSIISSLNYILDIFKTLWFGLGSLVSGAWELITSVFSGGVFDSVGSAFSYIGGYIGGPATVLLATVFLYIIFRIGVAFLFKILRLNIDYHLLQEQTKKINK